MGHICKGIAGEEHKRRRYTTEASDAASAQAGAVVVFGVRAHEITKTGSFSRNRLKYGEITKK